MAQYLKEEIKKKILDEGIEEFYQYGYKSSSMRNIAQNAGVSTGNLYRYYDNKEALFEAVVSIAYQEIINILNTVSNQTVESNENLEEVLLRLLSAYEGHQKAFAILISGAKGSRFENAVTDMIVIIEEKIKTLWKSHPNARQLARPIAAAFVYGFRELFYRDDVETLMIDYVHVIASGMRS